MEKIDHKELCAELGFSDGWPKYWTCIADSKLNRRLALHNGELCGVRAIIDRSTMFIRRFLIVRGTQSVWTFVDYVLLSGPF